MAIGQDQHLTVADRIVPPRVHTPMLAILPGTTAVYAALEFMSHARELSESDRKRIALIYIDTDQQPAELINFRKQHAGMFKEYVIKIAVPPNIRAINKEEQDNEPDEPHTYIGGKPPEYFAAGAGGIRNNGHVALCYGYNNVFREISRALDEITSREANEEYGQPEAVQVNIASFIGGGTASGVIADLACMVREILMQKGLRQPINLTCILPTNIAGNTDIGLRQSNAVACLAEIIALGQAAGQGQYYKKFMRTNMQYLSRDNIANEIFLIGDAGMTEPKDIARVVGLDLFHRTLDASGVGELERARSVDRTMLNNTDDRELPTMFGTSCPLEVRFPAPETALAFAQIAASHLLPLLTSYQPRAPMISENDRIRWQNEWRAVARRYGTQGDPMTVEVPQISRTVFENVTADGIEILWGDVERKKKAVTENTKAVMDIKRGQEVERIKAIGTNIYADRVRYLQRLYQEYEIALDGLMMNEVPLIPDRPNDMEHKVLHRPFLSLSILNGDAEEDLFEEYNDILKASADVERYQQLKALLEDLKGRVKNKLDDTSSWSGRINPSMQAPQLLASGKGSAAWRGQLDARHLFQQHIFQVPTLMTQSGRNIAIERLYGWATFGDSEISEGSTDQYKQRFLADCMAEIAGGNDLTRLQKQSPQRLVQRIINFFQNYYLNRFRDVNLFELLECALPPTSQDGKSLEEQMEIILTEQIAKLQKQMTPLVNFDEQIGGMKTSQALSKEIFIGCNWHDGQQMNMLKDIINNLDLGSKGGINPPNLSLDPHRLQILYGNHAISLSTIPDFYYGRNSAMEQYKLYQNQWEFSQRQGARPPHTSNKMETLVTDANVLGYIDPQSNQGKSLIDRLIRLP